MVRARTSGGISGGRKFWEDFDCEIHGRVPSGGPAAKWGWSTFAPQEGRAPLITNLLVGQVDNPSYLLTAVDIHLSFSTPASAWGDYGSLPGGFGKAGSRPTWQ